MTSRGPFRPKTFYDSIIHKVLPGSSVRCSFDKEEKMPSHSLPIYIGFQNVIVK